MKSKLLMALTASLFTTTLIADEVKVDGVHLCCGKCVTAAKDSLSGVEGVSKVRVNKNAETVIFEVSNAEAAKKGLKSLADAGFYGKTSVDGPDFGVDKEAKSDSVEITGLHLCCGGCIRSAVEAVEGVDGVASAQAKGDEGKISITGSKVSLAGLLKALHNAGFHGNVK